ncbi:RagB/SusD family nutrient uptake outer membrane protein [Sphingobacterium yanglingense]|uniref:Putative outer membrane starch-binding protein n=1 Tax=Sphingobacterium yanglingense TaxID=1437280 RepID=A0A4R6WIX9_9SPHI|nr:RagB/SusD family nutrient uptake outer membrane protein [Sphingobacterium yanglingense]TDQ80203.1 putative outer membrane starch-binding protein [Sphingobacterium yanglingense]
MKNIKNIGILLMAIGMLGSCEKSLIQDPKTTITVNTAWQSESDVQAEIAAAYSFFRSPLTTYYAHYAYGEFRAGDVKTPIASNLERNDLGTDYYTIDNWRDWGKFYRAIAQCNLILEKTATMDDDLFKTKQKAYYHAEVRFLRSYIYFYMTRIWGDVPLNLEGVNKKPLPRLAKEKIWDFCIQEAEAAYDALPLQVTVANERGVKPTKIAVLALISHIHMFSRNYEAAEKTLRQIQTNEGAAGLELLPFSKFKEVIKGRSKESIFEINFNDKEASTYSTLGAAFARPPEIKTKIWEACNIPVKVADELFPVGTSDLRVQWVTNRSNTLDITLNKFDVKAPDFTVTAPKYEANIILSRYAEILLLHAEVLARNNKPNEAITQLNRVRARSTAALYDAAIEPDLLKAILKERRKELIGEGYLWYDVVRTDRVPEFNSYITATHVEEGATYWPVSAYSFDGNPHMVQTSFWSK